MNANYQLIFIKRLFLLQYISNHKNYSIVLELTFFLFDSVISTFIQYFF